MLLPLNTDAPIYHFPFATIGMIVVNTIVFGMMLVADPADSWLQYKLHHGNGFHPIQWVTSNFMHLDIFHLIGNMIFLWGFGLVVEGKLGWWRYLVVFMAIGISQSALEQTLMLGFDPLETHKEYVERLLVEDIDALTDEDKADLRKELDGLLGGSIGASSIISGLMAIAMVWAPKNEVTVLLFILFRGITFELTIMVFAIWYIGWEILSLVMMGFAMSSQLLHVMGAAIGFGVGVLFVKRNWVDCEGWDLFTVMTGEYGSYARDRFGYETKKKKKNKKSKKADSTAPTGRVLSDEPAPSPIVSTVSFPTSADSIQEVVQLIEQREFAEAAAEYADIRSRDATANLKQTDCLALANGLVKQKQWQAARDVLQEYISRFSHAADPQRLTLGQIYLQIENEPHRALQVVSGIDPSKLSEKQQASFEKIVSRVRKHTSD